MFATILSGLFAFVFLFTPFFNEVPLSWSLIATVLALISLLFFLGTTFFQSTLLTPLQGAEKNFTPRVINLYKQDSSLNLMNLYLHLFPLLTLLSAISMVFLTDNYKKPLLALWIVLFGLALDFFSKAYKQTFDYLNPLAVIKKFTKAAQKSIRNDKEEELCDWIDALTESAVKAIQRSNSSLGTEALNELQVITGNFLQASKSISHPSQNEETKQMGISDKVSFTLFYLFQRLALINEKGTEKGLEPICSSVVTNLGKISMHAAKFDLSLASYPLYFLGTAAKKAQEKNIPDVWQKATSTLLEIAKAIPEEIDVTYLELKDPYFTLITQMQSLAQEAFKQDKTLSVPQLAAPFREIKELFSQERLSQHPDTPAILTSLNQAIGEFDALELVLRTIPPLPQFGQEPA